MKKGLMRIALLMTLIVSLGASSCQQRFDEVCDFAKEAVEVTRAILDAAGRDVDAAQSRVDIICVQFGSECTEAQDILKMAKRFLVDAGSEFVKAEFLVTAVCLTSGTLVVADALPNADRAVIRRDVKDLRAWMKAHRGTP